MILLAKQLSTSDMFGFAGSVQPSYKLVILRKNVQPNVHNYCEAIGKITARCRSLCLFLR